MAPPTSEPENGFIVVTQVGNQTFGIVVDGVFHTEEIVVKPMSTKLRHIAMFSGNTILGDGSVIMIIDPNGIAQTRRLGGEARRTRPKKRGRARQVEKTVSLLVFRAGSQQPKAVPLSLVTRLEEIDCKKIELSNGRHLVQYRGQLMPLVRVSDEVRVRTEGAQPLLVFSDARPLDGPRGRRDRRHRRGQARHRGRQRHAGRCSAPRSSRARRPRSSTSATSCRSPSRTGSAARR